LTLLAGWRDAETCNDINAGAEAQALAADRRDDA
jgi:hypothetical protein